MVLLRRFGKRSCLTDGLSPEIITKKFLRLKKSKLRENDEGFAAEEARVQSVLTDNMNVFTPHPSKAQCFCLSELGLAIAMRAVQDL